MAFTTGNELGTAMCKALGVDPNTVRSISLTFEAGAALQATIEHYVEVRAEGPLLDVLTALGEYELRPKDYPQEGDR